MPALRRSGMEWIFAAFLPKNEGKGVVFGCTVGHKSQPTHNSQAKLFVCDPGRGA